MHKEEKLKNLFSAYTYHLEKTTALLEAKESRTKAKFAVSGDLENIQFGFFDGQQNFHQVEDCPLHVVDLNKYLDQLKIMLKQFKIAPYNLITKKGELKYIIISSNEEGHEILIRFVLRSKESLDRVRLLCESWQEVNPKIKVFSTNIQPEHKAIIEGNEEIILSKEKFLIHKFDHLKLALSSRSFFQVTPFMARKLYQSIAHQISIDRPLSLLDLYCGVGAFSFYASSICKKIVGIEISKEAIECAIKSNELNNTQIDFKALDAEVFIKENRESFESIIVNPPRRGLNKMIIDKILDLRPKYIYYSSCNAETLRNDLDELKESYELKSLQIFDMFPYTKHFETFAYLVRK